MATVTFGDFEWDAEKAATNASELDRFVAMGISRRSRILVVVHCERRDKIRIITARRATQRERETYARRRDT